MSLTRARVIQYIGILLALGLIALGYWYFNVRAGVTVNQSQTDVMTSGLVGFWSFNGDDMSGNTVYDRSGSGNNGGAAGTTKVAGKVGQALSFNGSSSSVNFSGNAPSITTYGTFSAWIYTNGDPGHSQAILKEYNSCAYGMTLASGTMNLTWSTCSPKDSGYAISANKWVFVAITVDNGTGKFYVDGTQVNQQAFGASGGNYMFFGFDNGSGFFNGLIDEVRIYNRTLSAGEIQSLYALGQSDKTNTSVSQPQGTGRLDSGLAGYWKLDENTGTSAGDASTNGNNGTLTNGPTWGTGQIGSMVDFDGTDDYIEIGSSIKVNNSDRGTFSAWIKNDTNAPSDKAIFGYGGGAISGAGLFDVYIDATTDSLSVQQRSDSGALTDLNGGTALATATWYHVAVVSDGSTYTLYLNGKPETLTVASGSNNGNWLSDTTVSGTVHSVIGALWNNGGLNGPIDAKLDEVRLYDRPLSPDEVAQLYRLTTPTGVDTGLKGYWSFDGQDMNGTTAYDRSGSGNNGTLTNGPAKAIGKLGQGLSFDGTDDYMDGGSAASLKITSILTLSAWFKLNSDYTSQQAIIADGVSAGDNSVYGLVFGYTDNKIEFWNNSSGPSSGITSNRSIADNNWHHVVATRTGSAGNWTLSLYIDGVLDTSATETSDPTTTGSHSVAVGRFGSFGGYYFKGSIDEVRVYNRILSAAEIRGLYDTGQSDKVDSSISQPQGTGRLDSGLAGYWKLDENTGTSAGDSSTNGNTGTLTNGPTWTTGQIGSAVTFDGTDDYVNIPDSAALRLAGTSATISLWANPSNTSVNKILLSKRQNSGSFPQYGIAVNNGDCHSPTTGKKIAFSFIEAGGTTERCRYTTDDIADGNWHHIVAVANKEADTLALYVDGVARTTTASFNNGSWPNPTNTDYLALGTCNGCGGSAYYANSLDEVRVYNRALSADEVSQLYRLTTPTGTDTGLKGYWSFNGQDMNATTAFDRSGAGNNGTLTNGPTVTQGKLGQGMSFDGSDDYVDAGSASSLDNLTQMTVSAWIRPNSFGTSNGGPIAYKNWYLNICGASGCAVANTLRLTQTFSIGGNATWYAPASSISLNKWQHIVVTYDRSSTANDPIFYIDGSAVSVTETLTPNGSADSDAASSLLIGKDSNLSRVFDGGIDEVRVYNRILTAVEIQALYNSGR